MLRKFVDDIEIALEERNILYTTVYKKHSAEILLAVPFFAETDLLIEIVLYENGEIELRSRAQRFIGEKVYRILVEEIKKIRVKYPGYYFGLDAWGCDIWYVFVYYAFFIKIDNRSIGNIMKSLMVFAYICSDTVLEIFDTLLKNWEMLVFD